MTKELELLRQVYDALEPFSNVGRWFKDDADGDRPAVTTAAFTIAQLRAADKAHEAIFSVLYPQPPRFRLPTVPPVLGKDFLTRCGKKATVTVFDPKQEPPYKGVCEGGSAFWRADGRLDDLDPNSMDLVAEWPGSPEILAIISVSPAGETPT